MRRILFISHGFPPYFGGAEQAAGELARAAARSGRWAVDVLTSDLGGRLPAYEGVDGMNVWRVPSRKQEWRQHTVMELISFLRAAGRWLPPASAHWDFVLAHFTLPAGAVARKIARSRGIPYGVVLHGSDVPGYQDRLFGRLYPFTRPWCRSVWRSARCVVAVSDDLRVLALKSWPEGQIAVLPNGVDTEIFRPAVAGRKPGRLLVTVAQLIARKGLADLLRALATPRLVKAQLRICGVGPHEGKLRSLAQELELTSRVDFAGLVSRADLPGVLQQADVFVLPSHCEGHPLALLEAMACGRPVVATSVGGIPGVIRSGENGWLVPPGRPDALADTLGQVLDDPAAAARCGWAARQTTEDCAWSRTWERYEELLAGSGRQS